MVRGGNKMNKLILILICIAILTTPVLATDYLAKFTVEKVENINGIKTWASTQTFSLNKSESKDYLGMVTVQYFDIDTTSSPLRVSIKTTGGVTTGFAIATGETKNIRGNYYDNASLANIDDIRIKMLELNPYSVTTINSTSDNPIYAYFYTDREWALRKDDSVTFDAKAQKASSDSGVSYSGNTALKEIYVYFKRLQTVPISITVSSKNEPSRTWDNEKIKFTIDRSDTYIFTVKYDITNPWGAATETINKYTLIVKGLESTTSSTQIYSTAPYDVYIGDTKTVPMTESGTFSSVNGATITPLSNNTYNFVFSTPGTYNLVYTTGSGQTTISFNAIQKPSTATTAQPQPTATVSASQKQQTKGGILGIDNTYLGLGLLLLILGIVYIKKNKGSGGGHYEAKKNV